MWGGFEDFACLLFWRKFVFRMRHGKSGFLVSHSVSQRMKQDFVKLKLLSAGINEELQPSNVNFLSVGFMYKL